MQYIPDAEEKYIEALLRQDTSYHREAGLERLCELYRKNFGLRKPQPMLTTLAGLMQDSHPKVRRWALNAYALVGKHASGSAEPIVTAIQNNHDNPEILSAGYAALFAVCQEQQALTIIKEKKLAIEGPYLVAAAQYSKVMRDTAVKQKVNLETACPLELKNAAILIGMDKAPENLFHPNHANKHVIGELNKHHDQKVVQYSVWAVAENSTFDIGDIKLEIKDIESFPESVRGWLYRLMVKNSTVALQHREYLESGANDNGIEARLGLAAGLNGVYFGGLEEHTRRWLSRERDKEIEALLYDHMASTSDIYTPYGQDVMRRYSECGHGSLERERLESAAQGTALYAELKKASLIQQYGQLQLLGDTALVSNTTINFGNNANVGNLITSERISGTTISAVNNVQNNSLKEALEETLGLLKNHNLSAQQVDEGQKLLTDTATSPSRQTLEKLNNWLTNIGNTMSNVDTIASKAQTISHNITALLQIFT